MEGKKLEFYMQLYFFVEAVRNSQSDKMQVFKSYLESRGSDLAKSNEFLHFYALPYIKKP